MKVQFPYKDVIHFEFDTQYELTSTMIRFQEFYESPYPEIKEQTFTLDEFMDVYAKNMGNFTYFEDWAGFNIPGKVYLNFIKKHIVQLRPKEKTIFKAIPLKYLSGLIPFYIIATLKNDSRTFIHELAHALYQLNEDYYKEIFILANALSKRTKSSWFKKFKKWGYCEEVWYDELQAYNVEKRTAGFRKIFNKYYKRELNETK